MSVTVMFGDLEIPLVQFVLTKQRGGTDVVSSIFFINLFIFLNYLGPELDSKFLSPTYWDFFLKLSPPDCVQIACAAPQSMDR